MKDFLKLEKKLDVSFNNKELLCEAFTHRSYINESKRSDLSHNERLEFLGDAVLELVVTDYLFKKYPDNTEGDLTSYRSALVNAVILGDVAKNIGMNEYLLLSKGESKDTGKARQIILANTFESFVGALYQDQGYESAETFIQKYLLPLTDRIVEQELWQDAKSYFQEKAQEEVGVTPVYKVTKEVGPDHDKRFSVAVYLKDDLIAEAEGMSKQEAEQGAASKALKQKGWNKAKK